MAGAQAGSHVDIGLNPKVHMLDTALGMAAHLPKVTHLDGGVDLFGFGHTFLKKTRLKHKN